MSKKENPQKKWNTLKDGIKLFNMFISFLKNLQWLNKSIHIIAWLELIRVFNDYWS